MQRSADVVNLVHVDMFSGEIEVIRKLIREQKVCNEDENGAVNKKSRLTQTEDPLLSNDAVQFVSKTLTVPPATLVDATGMGPRKCLKSLQLRDRPLHEKDDWFSQAHQHAMLGSCQKSLKSVKSGVLCFVAFAVNAGAPAHGAHAYDSMFPPSVSMLVAWSLTFRCHKTFGNYLTHVKCFCLVLSRPVQVNGLHA